MNFRKNMNRLVQITSNVTMTFTGVLCEQKRCQKRSESFENVFMLNEKCVQLFLSEGKKRKHLTCRGKLAALYHRTCVEPTEMKRDRSWQNILFTRFICGIFPADCLDY